MIVCDLCNNSANLHICDRCCKIAKRLMEIYEEKRKEPEKVEVKKKRGRPKKKLSESPPSKRKLKEVTKKAEKEKPKDSILSKCWTCAYGFIGTNGNVACTEEKEPETCGQK